MRVGVALRSIVSTNVVSRSLSSAPRLPLWGSFGKMQEDIADLEARVREDGERKRAISRRLNELGLRGYIMLSRPVQWL